MSEDKKKRQTWKSESLQAAVTAVLNKEMGTLKAARQFGVPRSTIREYVKKICVAKTDETEIGTIVKKALGRKPSLNFELEKKLVAYCKEMEANFFGLTRADIKLMAYQLALRNNIPHPFSKKTNTAGRKWLSLFLKRNSSELSIRTPQSLSRARIIGFNETNVKKFYSILKPELEKIKYNPSRTFNVDETGITVVQSKNIQVIAAKGKSSVCKISSGERGKLNTIVTCMSAAGQYVPPMIVFPRKKRDMKLMKGAPPGSIAGFHPSGWIQCDLFCAWMQHFVNIVKPTKDDPVLLVLDGHYSHTRNLEVINYARENHISMVCLPPHSTHKMQPLDVAFMKPFKTFYNQEIERWLSANDGRVVTQYEIAELMGNAFIRAATMNNAISGFRATGICPFNDTIFTEGDYLAEVQITDAIPNDATALSQLSVNDTINISSPIDQTANDDETTDSSVAPKDIRPIPKVQPPTRKGKSGKSAVLTSSPYKKDLEQYCIAKEVKKNKQPSTDERQKKNSVKNTKRNILQPIIQPSTSGLQKKNPLNTKNRKKKIKKDITSSSSENEDHPPLMDISDDDVALWDIDDAEEMDATCSFCTQKYSDDFTGQIWLMCVTCFKWNHKYCDAASEGEKKYKCSFCLNN